jgi:beta-1,4-mannosyl-glycoprotein beta-1,4-N-acetylglucosaminyltransferase
MIFDCFTYFNEPEILEVRVNELKDLPVTHILVESDHTFVGNKRDIHKHLYDNLIHEVVLDMPNNGNPWDNESHQRNCIKRALLKQSPKDTDIIIISDVDEIPSAKTLKEYDGKEPKNLIMTQYSYYFNLLQGYQTWTHAKILTWAQLKHTQPQEIRHTNYYGSLHNAGWHFGWLGDADKLMYKFKNFSHQEQSVQKHADLDRLKLKIEKGISLWGDDSWEFTNLTELPIYIQENQNKFSKLIKF